ncbi:Wzz/FepE/Etk N-terminal domain-containing protein [Sphingobacterium sp. KU25419]|nr:Wzz/FepE/Etk N-terminal domain-containing protein [Sphingobacterium sp. KU25419]
METEAYGLLKTSEADIVSEILTLEILSRTKLLVHSIMNIFHYIFRAIFRIKWWLLILPLLFAVLAIYMTRNLDRQYKTDITIYTGVISSYGSDPGESNASSNWNVLNNSIQNIINTINSKETLKRLSLQLYARLMIHGDPNKDNVYFQPSIIKIIGYYTKRCTYFN